MNALTIPELNLFNNRRMSPTKRDYIYPTSDQIDRYNYKHITRNPYNPYRDDTSLFNTGNNHHALFSQNRYKQIAQTYLQQQPTPYSIQSYPYLYNIPSYLSQPTPELYNKQPHCQCEAQILMKDSIHTKKLHRHNYIGMKEQPFPTRQPRILKQPYLQATFRERKPSRHQQYSYVGQTTNNMNFNNKQGNKSKIIDKLKTNQSKDEQQSKIGPINNLIVSQKHQISIQTDNKPSTSPISHSIQTTRSQYHNQSTKQSKATVQRILQQQKMMIQSMKMEFQRQNDFKFHVQDLQTTKNDYIDRSRELLLKLNELADDKREFGFIFKAFTNDHKKHNVFGSLQD